MWIVGDWGQASPWSRNSGVLMTKGENDVYTGELSIPKGTKFDIKILKSTVSTTSGGNNTWSAVRYTSTLNTSASHDFGEFTDNLIPNGNFDEGQVKWTPAKCITLHDGPPYNSQKVLVVGGSVNNVDMPSSCASDVFVIPPNQTLRLTGYTRNYESKVYGGVTMKVVTPQQQTLFEFSVTGNASSGQPESWAQFSKTFKTADVPMECQIVLSNTHGNDNWTRRVDFESLSLIST